MKIQRIFLITALGCILLLTIAACSTQATVDTTPAPTPTADIHVAATTLAATSVASSATSAASQPSPTPTPTTAISANSTTAGANTAGLSSSDAIKHFYLAIQAHNYTAAYTYVDAGAKTTDGQTLTTDTFTQLARNEEGMSGKLSDISLGSPVTDPTQIVMTLTRGEGMRYHAHFQMKKEGELWKITSLDRI